MIAPPAIVVAMFGLSIAIQPTEGVPELSAQPADSDTGHFRLVWELGVGADVETCEVELQESMTADFANPDVIYRGPQQARVLSGKPDGTYYYRIRCIDGDFAEPLAVHVHHHSLTEALSFLAVGAVVFVATAVLIVGGHLRYRKALRTQGEVGER